MAEDISNKTLAALLAVAVIVSLGGTLIVLKSGPVVTGLSTDSAIGTAQVEIQAQAQLDIVNDTIDFGTGFVNPGNTSCLLNSGVNSDSVNCSSNGTWSQLIDGINDTEFLLRNTGNIDLNITMVGGAASWIGGTSPLYEYASSTATVQPGCFNQTGGSDGAGVSTFRSVATAGIGDQVCANLTFGSSTNQLEVDLQIEIPADAPPGAKTDTVTFTGTSL